MTDILTSLLGTARREQEWNEGGQSRRRLQVFPLRNGGGRDQGGSSGDGKK